MRIFPSFSFGYGLMNTISVSAISSIERDGPLMPSDMLVSGGDLLMMALMGLVYTFLVFVCEYVFTVKKMGRPPPNIPTK